MTDHSVSDSRAARPHGLRALLLSALVVLGLTMQTAAVSLAQPVVEANAETATLELLPYLLQESDLPGAYESDATRGFTNEAQVFDYDDSRPIETLLAPMEAAGRVVVLRQFFVDFGDPDAAEIRFSVARFRTAQGAALALQDPSLISLVMEDEVLEPVAERPALGNGSARYRTALQDADGDLVIDRLVWQRGPLVFVLLTQGAPEAVADLMLGIDAIALNADERYAALPPAGPITPAPAYMPSGPTRLALYQALRDRLLAADALVGFLDAYYGVIPNPILLLDAQEADEPIAGPEAMLARLEAERRVLGLVQVFEASEATAVPEGSRFPTLAVGYHLYADAAGAAEALGASAEEVALRFYQEPGSPFPALTEVASPVALGEQTRAFTGRVRFGDGVEVDVMTLRWRRGAVELFADAMVAVDADPVPALVQIAEQLDAAYQADPLPGF